MEVIPVLDLMSGQVVHAVRGERGRYRPVESVLTSSSAPLPVAQALRQQSDCAALYVADLDAIQGRGRQDEVIRMLADQLEVDLWIDAAIADAVSAARLLDAGATRVIVGSETLASMEALREIREALVPGQFLFSLDIRAGGVMSRCPALLGLAPPAALDVLAGEGLLQVIVLTLDQVGAGEGPNLPVLESARADFPHLSLIAGGGVRGPDDLRRLASLGVDGALVATSLHRGWITAADLRDLRRD